jgi:hypothetical protein
MSEMIPDTVAPPIEAVMQTMAGVIESFVTPENAGDSEAGKAVLRAYMARVRDVLDKLEKRD